MPYTPPSIRLPLPPLRPPVRLPWRPPILIPPPQTSPQYNPPTFNPPTSTDLKGVICVYANTPIWHPKKIRYKYPGENWQEIIGDHYIVIPNETVVRGGQYFSTWELVSHKSIVVREGWKRNDDNTATIRNGIFTTINRTYQETFSFTGTFVSWEFVVPDGHIILTNFTDTPTTIAEIAIYITYQNSLGQIIKSPALTEWPSVPTSGFFVSREITELHFKDSNSFIPPEILVNCQFKVFDKFDQVILDITKYNCPEIQVIPERCFYQNKSERLVRKVPLGFFQSLRVEYTENCATVLLDARPLPFPTTMYRECSEHNCPPPLIRFDQKCEEKCEQCPPGTAVKVLLGSNIACVDVFGCIKKTIKYKRGCNNYDCICG
ncbi:MAG: hypothetical protein ACK48H_21265 [Microcystis sp.]|uniref:hypothetical protein n=1 Tax=Microcystis sp. TaxID=1127 RepID=UPI00391D18AC